MTHKDIYTKFMIEYDKANVTSSYPSLTEYEVATVLDKAYNALIAQKVTGNNVRRAPFEADIKSIADITPLITNQDSMLFDIAMMGNVKKTNMPSDMLYYVSSNMYTTGDPGSIQDYEEGKYNPMDESHQEGVPFNLQPVPTTLVSHEIAKKFFRTSSNMPWIKNPVCYIEGKEIFFVFDPIKRHGFADLVNVTYIKKPNTFVKNLQENNSGYRSFFDWGEGNVPANYKFECNDTVAEELISLAVAFALENVESQRLNSKLNMRGLEA